MTNVFAVVGQHRAEPGRLLLRGDDGRYYAYAANGHLSAVEPSNAWVLDGAEDRRPAARSGERVLVTASATSRSPGGTARGSRRPFMSLVAGLAVIVTLLLVPTALAHAPALATATSDVLLHATPDLAAPVLGVVPVGETVELTGAASGGFLEVNVRAQVGWVEAACLDDGIATAVVSSDAVLRLGPNPTAETVRAVPAGSTVILTGAQVDNFLAASFDGSGGWIESEALG